MRRHAINCGSSNNLGFDQTRRKYLEANAVDLEGLKFVIDERAGINGVEYLCLFDDERTEWLPVPSWMDAFADFKKYKADHTEKE